MHGMRTGREVSLTSVHKYTHTHTHRAHKQADDNIFSQHLQGQME